MKAWLNELWPTLVIIGLIAGVIIMDGMPWPSLSSAASTGVNGLRLKLPWQSRCFQKGQPQKG